MISGDFAPFRLTICGIEELAGHCDARATHVLSILDPGWPVPEAFGSFDEHHRVELRFHDAIDPQPGHVLPQRHDVEQVLAFGRELTQEKDPHLLVHCHAGISRSTASASLILMQACPDRKPAEVFDAITRLRPKAWPNLRMLEFGDALLGRGGEIVAAAPAVYRRLLDDQPRLKVLMTDNGRGREVAAALAL